MKYNFDEIIDRSNTASVKYDLRQMFFGTEDIIPMWVADMDFKTPPFIIDAIKNRLEHPVLGYSIRTPEYHDAIREWVKRRHDWDIQNEWICFSPGIVPALNMSVLAFTKPGDSIVVQPPVYFPFFSAVEKNDRVLLQNPLILENGRYRMDFEDLEKHCKNGASMIIISNPHNPGGNAWNSSELRELAAICLKYNVLMVSDEIHADLVNIGFKHTILASLSEDIAAMTITMTAPSKTFNMAALSTASVIISNNQLRKVYNNLVQNLHIDMGNVFGNVASIAAYCFGDEWLNQLLVYLKENIDILEKYLIERIPQIKMIRPEATYMAWLDCSGLNMDDKSLNEFMIKKAHLGLNPGIQFGKGGNQFMRINLACPRSTLIKALQQLESAIIEA
ncbi:MAG: MalY/PatB family protein [Omnitrophica WOR_2 bacterium]|jgi:cystathionine beta-lyase